MKPIIHYQKMIICIFIIFFLSCTKNGEGIDEGSKNLPERIIIDTAYGADAAQKMDIYLPAGRNNSTKMIVLLHGGGWIGGDKKDLNNFVALFRSKWPEAAILNINYRFANGSTVILKNMLDDIGAAIQLVTRNRKEFAVSNKLALFGNSAGGHLAAQYGYTRNADGNVKAVADLYGPAKINDWAWYNVAWPNVKDWLIKLTGKQWNEALYASASPLSSATSASPPTIIFHSKWDIVVPVAHSEQLKAKLESLNVPVSYTDSYVTFHVFNDADNDDCAAKCVAFFKTHME